MGTMFDKEWLTGFYTRWNSTPEMTEPLGQAKFHSLIAFGYKDEEHPRIAFKVENGKIVKATLAHAADTRDFDWDLRATPEQWEAWRKQPLTIMSLGPAVAQGVSRDIQGKAFGAEFVGQHVAGMAGVGSDFQERRHFADEVEVLADERPAADVFFFVNGNGALRIP